jgi:hypothetical protein
MRDLPQPVSGLVAAELAKHTSGGRRYPGRAVAAELTSKDPSWLAKEAKKLTPLDEMADAEETALRKMMDRRFPRRR